MAERAIIAKTRLQARESRLAYLLLLPAVACVTGFMIYPLVSVGLMSVFRTNRLGWLQNFVGLANYFSVMADVEFWQVTGRSILWTVLAVLSKTFLGLVIALLLNVSYRGRKIARMLFIAPWASSVPISVLLWSWVYNPQFGLLNHTLKITGITANPPIWLGYPISGFIAAIWVDIWIGIPFMALVFLAGMQAIPEDLYESADLDGVNGFQKFYYITLPGIKRILQISTLLSALWTFNDFNSIFILTGGGPVNMTDILITSIYKNAFVYARFDRAAVMAIITFIILTMLSAVYARHYFREED
ncbi:MAG: carbohydrate ABC transporter permease [Clostridia bacterium]